MDKLAEMTANYPTQFWNDSCSQSELKYAIERGATGATTNPVIVKNVLEKELDTYRDFIEQLVLTKPGADEDEIAWLVIENLAVSGAKLLEPFFDPQKGHSSNSVRAAHRPSGVRI